MDRNATRDALDKWRGVVECHIAIRFGYNPIRRDAILTAFQHRYPARIEGDTDSFYNWLQGCTQHLSLGRLPHLPLDDAIEATLDPL